MSLNPRHLKVVNHYLIHGSKPEAMRHAGYSETTSYYRHSIVFDRPEVQEHITKRQQKMIDRNAITEDWLIERLMDVADANPGDLIDVSDPNDPKYDFSKLSPQLRRAISGVDINIEQCGRGENATPVHKI